MFSERIRLLRGERHLTQADVAQAVGLSTRGYQDLELHSPVTGEETSMEIDDAARYLEGNGNVFIGYIP